MAAMDGNLLGAFLKARRARLSPEAGGVRQARRRTPGLRREEVAQRADISAKWYTFLEQGRGGAPSADVLDRLSGALKLSEAEREHLFHLVRPRPRKTIASVSPALQRLLDALGLLPAFVKTSAWDIVAWNRAAALTLTDYGAIAPGKRNLLRLLFSEPGARESIADWESHARFAVAAFRLETARVGTSAAAMRLVDELSRSNRAFADLWHENEVGTHGEGTKTIRHPLAGVLTFEYSTFAVGGQPDLGLVLFTPATPSDAERVRALVRT